MLCSVKLDVIANDYSLNQWLLLHQFGRFPGVWHWKSFVTFSDRHIFVTKGLMSKINVLAYKNRMVDVFLKAFVNHRKSKVTRKQ